MAAQKPRRSSWPSFPNDKSWYNPAKATNPRPPSGLFSLPPELRNHIYTLVLQQPQAISITLIKNTPKLLSHKKNLLSLTRVSQQVRHECLRLFYTINRFSLHTDILNRAGSLRNEDDIYWHWVTWISAWLESIGRAQVQAMGRITVQLGHLPAWPLPGDGVVASLVELGKVLGRLARECLVLGITCAVRFDMMGVVRVTKTRRVALAPSILVDVTHGSYRQQVDVAKMSIYMGKGGWRTIAFAREVDLRRALIDCLFDAIGMETLDAVV